MKRAGGKGSTLHGLVGAFSEKVGMRPGLSYLGCMAVLFLAIEPAAASGAAWAWIVAALILVGAEFLLPGMVIGLVGAAAGIFGLVLAAKAGFIPFLLHAAVLVLGLVAELMIFRKLAPSVAARLGLASHATSPGSAVPAGTAFADLVGREGVALTALAPGGMAEVAGRRVQASSIDGFLDKGQAVVVVAVAPGGVTVRRR
mgnify:CR=1 FL=1